MDSRTQAIVLHRTNYGEYDRIIQCITTDGKKSLIAKGVRKERSKLAGGIELFSLSDTTAHHGRGDLDILTSARLVKFYSRILEDYPKLQFGYEVLKVISARSDQIDDPEFFDLTRSILEFINHSDNLILAEVWFYLNLARVCGDELNLHVDTAGEKLIESSTYIFNTSDQSFQKSDRGPITARHIKFLRLVTTNQLDLVARVSDITDLLPDCLPIAKSISQL